MDRIRKQLGVIAILTLCAMVTIPSTSYSCSRTPEDPCEPPPAEGDVPEMPVALVPAFLLAGVLVARSARKANRVSTDKESN